MPMHNHRLKNFTISFRKSNRWEVVVSEAMANLPYGNGKTIFMRMMKTFFDDCHDPASLAEAINEMVEQITSHGLLNQVKTRYDLAGGRLPGGPKSKRGRPRKKAHDSDDADFDAAEPGEHSDSWGASHDALVG